MPSTASLPLSALLSKALIAFTLEFDEQIALTRGTTEGEPPPTLAMWSNVLRFVGEAGVDERRLPSLSGVSKPAIHSMVACLERHRWITVGADPSDKRAKIIRLTPGAHKLEAVWQTCAKNVEKRWRDRFGDEAVVALRRSLETIATNSNTDLPHYPMALSHRGGTPTGL